MTALRRFLLAAVAVAALCGAAADPAERLRDPAQEARARALFKDIRCLVCQSQSIDESEAPLAHDLRQLVRDEVAAGRSDDQIRAFLVSRYGQFVLLSPKLSLGNAVLWIGPLLVVLVGAAAFAGRRRDMPEASTLSVEEEARLQNLTHDETA